MATMEINMDNINIDDNALIRLIEQEESKSKSTVAFKGIGPLPGLSGRLRSMYRDARELSLVDWKNSYQEHPAYEWVVMDIRRMVTQRGLDRTMDYLDNLGCISTYNTQTGEFGIGMSEKLFPNINEKYTSIIPSEKGLLDKINGMWSSLFSRTMADTFDDLPGGGSKAKGKSDELEMTEEDLVDTGHQLIYVITFTL